jgi:peptidoglycan/LPS O-acetylase OafA/YrhL
VRNTGRSFIALDGLRGVAALCIVWLHVLRYVGEWHLPTAYLAVDLFFALSGFVLAHAYEHAFRAGLSPWRFMLQRLIRLYPLYLLGIALGMSVAMLSIRYHGGGSAFIWTWERFSNALPYALFMLPCPPGVDAVMYPFNGVMWSIFFELLVNLLWATTWRWLHSTRALLVVVLIAGIGLIVRSLASSSGMLGVGWPIFLSGLARVLFAFPLGILLYRVHQRWKLPALPTASLLISLPVLFLIPRGAIQQLILAMVVLPAIVLLTSYARPTGMLALICTFLGEASYAVYALHKRLYELSYAGFLKIFQVRAEAWAPWIALAFIAVLIAVCIAVHRWFDVPVRRGLAELLLSLRAGSETRQRLKSG